MIKIFICGGHLSPALAIIERSQKNKIYKIFYLGRKNALEGDNANSLEYTTIQKLGISFLPIHTGRLQRSFTWHTLFSLLKIPVGIIESFYYLINFRPQIIVAFGSYLAIPICISAWMMNIPVITHEQTYSLGLANKLISKFSKILALSFADTQGIPRGIKTQITGNPLRESLFAPKNKSIISFGDKGLPLIYVTGGNLGSRSINKIIGELVPKLVNKYRIFHQCGNADNEADFKFLSKLQNSLSGDTKSNYKLIKHIDPAIVGVILQNTTLLIGRAGANTVNEIIHFGVPSILIPLPWSGQAEQEENAKLVKQNGLGEVIVQKDLNPDNLSRTVELMIKNLSRYQRPIDKLQEKFNKDSLSQMEKLIQKYAQKS